MKGVSEVIAIILILMIVIALSALAYTWFSGIFASMTQSAGTAVTTTTNEMATQFRIEASKSVAVGVVEIDIRNTGTQDINASTGTVAFFADGTPNTGYSGATQPLTCVGCAGTCTGCGTTCPACRISPGGVAVYRLTWGTIVCGTNITRVTIGTGLTDSKPVAC